MTFKEIKDELRANIGNRPTTVLSETRLGLWVNNAQLEILSGLQFFESEKRVSTPMVIAQALYQLPSDCIAIYDLRDDTQKRKIIRSHYRKFDNIDSAQAGNPTHYIRFGGYIQLTPVPSATNTLYLRYCVAPTAMSADADVPTLSAFWHECILLGAEWRAWRSLKEKQEAMLTKNEYLAMVRSRQSEWEIEESDEEFGIELER